MSQFLAPYYDAIPLGYTIVQVQNQIAGYLTTNGWQQLAQVDGSYTDLIPPPSETIGTSKFREVVRIYYPNNTTITVGSYQACIADAYAQSIRIKAKTAGAVAAAVTIDGVTITGATGSAGSTANDNLRELFYALKASANATIMGWDHWYNGTDIIVCTNKTITTAKTCSGNANVNYYALAAPVQSGARSGFVNLDTTQGYSVTIDLTSGFIVYVQVNKRTFSLATKCLTGVYGPVFASYIDHTEAINATPTSGYCTPMELWVGEYSEGSGTWGYTKPTHFWSIPLLYATRTIPSVETTSTLGAGEDVGDFNTWSGGGVPGTFTDCCFWVSGYSGVSFVSLWGPIKLLKHGLIDGTNHLDAAYKVVPVGNTGASFITYTGTYQYGTRITPAFSLPDVYKWVGTEPNEACAMANPLCPTGLNGVGITLQQNLDATTSYTTLSVSTTTGLPAVGGIVLGIEEFTYTGTSGGNTLTGVTRAQNGTVGAKHYINDIVEPVTWFLKVNNGALMSGADRPV